MKHEGKLNVPSTEKTEKASHVLPSPAPMWTENTTPYIASYLFLMINLPHYLTCLIYFLFTESILHQKCLETHREVMSVIKLIYDRKFLYVIFVYSKCLNWMVFDGPKFKVCVIYWLSGCPFCNRLSQTAYLLCKRSGVWKQVHQRKHQGREKACLASQLSITS